MSTLLGLMSITMVMASFYAMRSWGLWLSGNQRMGGPLPPGVAPPGTTGRAAGLPASAIHSLPVVIFESASTFFSELGGLCWGKGQQAGLLADLPVPSTPCPSLFSCLQVRCLWQAGVGVES